MLPVLHVKISVKHTSVIDFIFDKYINVLIILTSVFPLNNYIIVSMHISVHLIFNLIYHRQHFSRNKTTNCKTNVCSFKSLGELESINDTRMFYRYLHVVIVGVFLNSSMPEKQYKIHKSLKFTAKIKCTKTTNIYTCFVKLKMFLHTVQKDTNNYTILKSA
jgi:hypothetical protein